MSPRLPPLDRPPTGFGHLPDQSEDEDQATAVKAILERGAAGIDGAVRLSGDGIPVLRRSGRVGSRLRRRPVAELDHAQLPDGTLDLARLYQLVGGDVALLLEVEDPAAFDPMVEVARVAGPEAESNLWLCHPDLAVLTSWRPRTGAKLFNSTRVADLPGGLERRAAELEQRNLDGLKLFHTDWSGGRVTLLHRFGLLTVAWGARYPRELAEVVDAGIDELASASVEEMTAILAEYYR